MGNSCARDAPPLYIEVEVRDQTPKEDPYSISQDNSWEISPLSPLHCITVPPPPPQHVYVHVHNIIMLLYWDMCMTLLLMMHIIWGILDYYNSNGCLSSWPPSPLYLSHAPHEVIPSFLPAADHDTVHVLNKHVL